MLSMGIIDLSPSASNFAAFAGAFSQARFLAWAGRRVCDPQQRLIPLAASSPCLEWNLALFLLPGFAPVGSSALIVIVVDDQFGLYRHVLDIHVAVMDAYPYGSHRCSSLLCTLGESTRAALSGRVLADKQIVCDTIGTSDDASVLSVRLANSCGLPCQGTSETVGRC